MRPKNFMFNALTLLTNSSDYAFGLRGQVTKAGNFLPGAQVTVSGGNQPNKSSTTTRRGDYNIGPLYANGQEYEVTYFQAMEKHYCIQP